MTKYCPKCKNAVEEDAIRCPHCNMRLRVFCPSCNTVNAFGEEKCQNCGTILIKYCEACHSANLPDAHECRKCQNPFEQEVLTFEKKRKVSKSKITELKNKTKQEIIDELVTHSEEQNDEISRFVQTPNHPIPTPIEQEQVIEEEPVVEEISDEIITDEPEQEVIQPVQEIEEEPIEEIEPIEEEQEEPVSEIEEPVVEEEVIEPDQSEVQEETEVIEEPTEPEVEEIQDIKPEQEEPVSESTVSQEEHEEQEEIEEPLEEDEQKVSCDSAEEVAEQLTNLVHGENNKIIVSVCAEEGMGKSTILSGFTSQLTEQGIVTICAEGSELIKVSPFGCIRDALLKLLTLPDIHPNIEVFYSENTRQLFVQNFETLDEHEITNFMNFLYPSMQGYFDDIYKNKQAMFDLLDKILGSIISKNKAVFVIDNFDFIDSISFEYISHLIKSAIINQETKLIVTYRENKSARAYFEEDLPKLIFTTIHLNNMSAEKTIKIVQNYTNTPDVPEEVNKIAVENGKGNIFFVEQFLSLLFDVGYMFIDENMMKFKKDEPIPFSPANIDSVISLRLQAIQMPEIKDGLFAASIMGYKFDKIAFGAVLELDENQTEEMLQKLAELLFIQKVSDYEYAFKNMTTWGVVFDGAQKDPKFKVFSKKIYYTLNQYALSNPTLKPLISKNREDIETAIQNWKEAAAICAYFGDVELYATAMEQLLVSSGYDPNSEDLTEEQLNAVEQIGKIVYKINPQAAIEYLTAPVINAKESRNTPKVIELCGYMIKACYKVSNYNGVIESADTILNIADGDLSPLDIALVKSRKLHALFKIGNCEEGINLANNDIIPVLEDALSKQNDPDFSQTLFASWFETSLNLIYLYALQGNIKAVDTANAMFEILQMNNIVNPDYEMKLTLAKALGLTVLGRIKDSFDLLANAEKMQEYNNPDIITKRNVIYALNLAFSNETDLLAEKLFEFAKYADDQNDQYGKHLFKLMVAWLIFKQGDFAKANSIFNEELTHYAKEKIVTGALISWLFIAMNTLATEGAENAEHIATKALEVAQNPKFSQYHAAVYLQKLIAEINILKSDAAAAKMYLEKGLLTAKQFGLELPQVELYRTYTNLMKQMMAQPNVDRAECAQKAIKVYNSAIQIAKQLSVPNLTETITDEYNQFVELCESNDIAISK